MNKLEQHYADRNHEAQGLHYIIHVSAMTAEGLHRKSAIAAELAHRDIEIARLKAENATLREALEEAPKSVRHPLTDKQILDLGPGQPDAVWNYDSQVYFARAIEHAHGIE